MLPSGQSLQLKSSDGFVLEVAVETLKVEKGSALDILSERLSDCTSPVAVELPKERHLLLLDWLRYCRTGAEVFA